jgi:hypothetical protein
VLFFDQALNVHQGNDGLQLQTIIRVKKSPPCHDQQLAVATSNSKNHVVVGQDI